MKKSEFLNLIAMATEQFAHKTGSHSLSKVVEVVSSVGLPVSDNPSEDLVVSTVMSLYRLRFLGFEGDGVLSTVRIFWLLEKAWEEFQERSSKSST